MCLDPDSILIQGVNRLRVSVIYNVFLSLRRRISFKGAVSEQEVRDSSVEMLQSYLTSIIESIVGSVDQCPPVMRVAFKQLHKRVEEQFAEPENEVSLEENAQKKNGFICICRACKSDIQSFYINITCYIFSYGC